MIKQVLTDARALYAAAPSHAPLGKWPENGTYCALSAITQVENGERLYWDARDALVEAVDSEHPTGLIGYNAEHTTEEVLAVFDRAIEAAS